MYGPLLTSLSGLVLLVAESEVVEELGTEEVGLFESGKSGEDELAGSRLVAISGVTEGFSGR